MNTEVLKEAASEARRRVKREQDEIQEQFEELKERHEELNGFMLTLEATEDLLAEIDRLKDENEGLREANEGLQQQLQEKDMQLKELNKLSAGVAKKSSQDDVSKAMRIYLNTSKRKTLSKREAAKTVFLELIAAAKLDVPEDIMDLLNHFDDEQLTEQPQSSEVPEVLAKNKYWQRVKAAGLVDENNLPTVSRPEAALMAEALAKRIGIDNKWKVFELMWQRNNMRNDYNTALEQQQRDEYRRKFARVIR